MTLDFHPGNAPVTTPGTFPGDRTIALTDADRETLAAGKRHSMAENTFKAYKTRFNAYAEWTTSRGFNPLPSDPTAVCLYIEHLSSREKPYAVTSLDQTLAAINKAHEIAGYPSPTSHPDVKLHRTAYKRRHTALPRRARALKTNSIARLVSTCDSSPIGVRDRALILTGYSLGMRSDNLVRLRRRDIQPTDDPHFLDVTLERSKTTLHAETKTLARGKNASTDPIDALDSWIRLLPDTDGDRYLFRAVNKGGQISTGDRPLPTRTVSRVLTRRAQMADLPTQQVSAHSLRRGFVSQALENGASEVEIMRTTSHKTSAMLAVYNDSDRRRNPASGSLGL